MSGSALLSRSRTPAGSHLLTARRPPRRGFRMLVAVLALLVLATAGWLVAFSGVFAVQQVEVTGVQVLTSTQVRTAAQVPLGTPLLRQDTDAITARVATLKLVKGVTVTRRWPRTIVVAVQERTPLLAVRQPDGFLLVDSSGVGFLDAPSVPKQVVLADVDPTNTPLLTQVGVVAAALPAKLKGKVSKIEALTPDGIKLVLKDGDVVTWGSSEQSAVKAEMLAGVLKFSARAYDVSAPPNATYRR
jgi:cell division protein FtsQ